VAGVRHVGEGFGLEGPGSPVEGRKAGADFLEGALPCPAVGLGRRAHEEREELEGSVVPAGEAREAFLNFGREAGGGGFVLQSAELGGALFEGGLEAAAEEIDDGGGEGGSGGPGFGAGALGAGGLDHPVILEKIEAFADGALAKGKARFDVSETQGLGGNVEKAVNLGDGSRDGKDVSHAHEVGDGPAFGRGERMGARGGQGGFEGGGGDGGRGRGGGMKEGDSSLAR